MDPTNAGRGVYRAPLQRLTGIRGWCRHAWGGVGAFLWLGLVGLVGCAGDPEVGGSGRFEASDAAVAGGSGEGESTRVLRLEGTPYEMGVWQGRLLASEIRARVARPLPSVVADAMASYEPALRDLWPVGARDELRGIAVGAGVAEGELFRREVVRDVVRWHAPTGPISPVAWTSGAGEEPELRVSWGDLDSMLGVGASSLVWVERRPVGGTLTRVLAVPGSVGGVAGVSGRGFVAVAGEDGSRLLEQRSLRGAALPVALRFALERGRTLDEVFDALPRTVGHRVLVAGPDNQRVEGVLALSSDDPVRHGPEVPSAHGTPGPRTFRLP